MRWQTLAASLAAATTIGCSDSGLDRRMAAPNVVQESDVAATATTNLLPRSTGLRFFVSGHSLTARPFADYVAGIARGFGVEPEWNGQQLSGSTIKLRSRGRLAAPEWSGYRSGENRDGAGLDVVAEFRDPRTIAGGLYEVLILTEEHSLLWTLLREDSVRHLRHYHDRFIEGNPAGKTYFYEPWIDIDDNNDPRRWIMLERASARIWRCVVERVNVSLTATGRQDRITPLPAGSALAELIERAAAGSVPSLGGDPARAVTAIVYDGVHLTQLGTYYLALVAYATIMGRPVEGAWAPPDLPAEQAEALQRIASEFLAQYRANLQPISLEECRSFLHSEFVREYWSYIRDTHWRKELSTPRAYVRWVRWLAESHYRFAWDGDRNPFHYDASTDGDYWLPSP